MHKGFKCLDPKEGRVYISRDVVFDESIFPFSSLHPNVGAQLRTELLLLPTHLHNPRGANDCGHNTCSLEPTDLSTSCVGHGGVPKQSLQNDIVFRPTSGLVLIIACVGPTGTAADSRRIHLRTVQHLVPDRLRDRCLLVL